MATRDQLAGSVRLRRRRALTLQRFADHMIVAKDAPGAATMLARIDKAIPAASADGTLARIEVKYGL
jgi:hypothetical protein